MSARLATTSIESNVRSAGLAGPDVAVRLVTAIVGTVVGLTFLFAFGNVATLGIRLGVPTYVAILAAPAVDLSVVALLVGTRHLVLHGGPVEVVRAARRLLIFSSTVTLALNIAEPLIAGHYGKAAFDAVGPLLLIGWSEVGPSLLQAMQTTTASMAALGRQAADDPTEPIAADRPEVPQVPGPVGMGAPAVEATSRGDGSGTREQDLLHRARAEDVLHWQFHHRPISAENLRKRLHIGAGTARSLVAQLRSDTKATFGRSASAPVPNGAA
ncbi:MULTISPECIES: hypothetical protein [Frankia]|uniref:DUF2637 domain-containing protein n=1 Tax=Frankia alni (strain DSM 45986 / CECT 9034 / ACN14a) TaxID=326424 RepID=Q0RQY0_FRAAA|nr:MULTISPECIES: hypothetical protein [Frankia]CAJ60043.1 hypothetical protein FRAAL1384 [Frankia alni ACN14a]